MPPIRVPSREADRTTADHHHPRLCPVPGTARHRLPVHFVLPRQLHRHAAADPVLLRLRRVSPYVPAEVWHAVVLLVPVALGAPVIGGLGSEGVG